MKRVLPTATIAVLTTAAALPAVAAAQPTTRAHAHAYERAYHQVAHEFGARVPGRNIVRDGLPGGRRPSDAQTVASLTVLQRMLQPAVPAAPSPSGAAATVSGAVSGGSAAGASGVPACASESGTNYSTGPSNTNPSSGATGRYQILPSTAAAYGCDLATAAGQDACAQVIYANQGASAWVGCGG
ncbi:MAG TPA: transglycosylase family protein [Solirubrobacteraceae bacterium]|nr:transglycosylase family protein [Solirubrobacteraceae bacterium]